jgi:iron complex outermembrane receptor protein
MVPNMDISTINGQSTPIIALRGVRSTNETELGDPAVGVHLDGVYSPRMQGILALMFDNERVEVLRGPQGTLFGRNSTVGSINIVSAKPKLDAFDGRVWLQYGNFDAGEVQTMVNVPLSDTFAVRFAGRRLRRDSYINGYWDPNQYDQRHSPINGSPVIAPGSFEACTSPECLTRTQHSNWWADETDPETQIQALVPADENNFYMNSDEWAYRLSALWQPKNKRMSLNLSFQRFQTESAGGIDLTNCEKLRGRPVYDFEYDDDGNLLGVYAVGTNDCSNMFPNDDTYQAVVNVPGRFFLDIRYARAQFNWDIKDNLRFVFLAGAEDQDRESAQDMEQSLNAWDQAMFFLPGTGSKSWSPEIQIQSFGNRRFNWIAGANYFHETTSTIGYFDNPLDEKSLWDQPNRSSDAWAIFGQGTYSFTPRWHLTLGYRYSDETKEDRGGRTYLCNNNNGCAPGLYEREDLNDLPADYFENPEVYPEGDISPNDNKGSWNSNDWRIGLDFDLNENTFLYSYLATGFKSGGIGDVFNETNPRTGEEIIARTSFGPESVTTLELGWKQSLLNRKLDLRGAYFYSDYEDMQYASVGAIAFTERFQVLLNPDGTFQTDENGNFIFGWVTAPIVAYFTQNVPGARIQGFELEYDWRAWRGGRIHGFASWLDTKITDDWITKWDYDPVSYFGLSFEESVDPTNELMEVNLKGNELAVSAPFKIRMTVDHAFYLDNAGLGIVPWVTGYWEADSYLTIWNVDRHTDDMDFVILDQDIRYTDDRRNAWSMWHAGVQFFIGNFGWELFGYNLTNEVVQYWGGAAEQVAKGSFSTPRTYGLRFSYNF